jgi:hypothetical protein
MWALQWVEMLEIRLVLMLVTMKELLLVLMKVMKMEFRLEEKME